MFIKEFIRGFKVGMAPLVPAAGILARGAAWALAAFAAGLAMLGFGWSWAGEGFLLCGAAILLVVVVLSWFKLYRTSLDQRIRE